MAGSVFFFLASVDACSSFFVSTVAYFGLSPWLRPSGLVFFFYVLAHISYLGGNTQVWGNGQGGVQVPLRLADLGVKFWDGRQWSGVGFLN